RIYWTDAKLLKLFRSLIKPDWPSPPAGPATSPALRPLPARAGLFFAVRPQPGGSPSACSAYTHPSPGHGLGCGVIARDGRGAFRDGRGAWGPGAKTLCGRPDPLWPRAIFVVFKSLWPRGGLRPFGPPRFARLSVVDIRVAPPLSF